MKIVTDHFETRTLLAGALVFPLVELEAAFNVERTSLLHVFANHLRLASPEGDVNKSCLLSAFTVVGRKVAIDGQTDISHGGTFRRVTHLGIPGDIPHQLHFVEIRHIGSLQETSGKGPMFFRTVRQFSPLPNLLAPQG